MMSIMRTTIRNTRKRAISGSDHTKESDFLLIFIFNDLNTIGGWFKFDRWTSLMDESGL